MSGDIKLHPSWRQAVQEFLATRPQPGDLVTRAQLEKWFDLKPPRTFEEFRFFELRFTAARVKWAEELMRKHQIQFEEKDRGAGGWRVLAPSEIAAFTRRQSDRDHRKAIRQQRERLAYTDLSELSPAQLREHAETLVRCSWKLRALKEADKKPIELPALPLPLPRKKG